MADRVNIDDLLDQPQMILDEDGFAVDDALIATSSAGLSADDAAIVTQLWTEEVDGVIKPYIAELYLGGATQIALGVGTSFPDPDLPGVPLLANQYAVTYLQTVTNQLDGVGNDVWELIRTELVDGLKQGQSMEQIAARIKTVSNFTVKESERVARTQVHSAIEAGNIAQVRYMGYADNEVTKEWVATLGDGRTRPTHIAAHMQTVPMNSKFTVGGVKLDFPGDSSGPSSEIDNCRCTVVYDIKDPPKVRCTTQAPSLVAAVTAAQDASVCVIPIKKPPVDWDYVPPGSGVSLAVQIFNEFMTHGISPAWGGAKIYKVLQETKKTLADAGHSLAGLTDYDLLAAVDKYYIAKKDTFFDKFVQWASSPAGKKALGSAPPPPAGVTAPISLLPQPKILPPPKLLAPPKLPAIPGQPKPSEMTFTGKTLGGVNGAQVWVDANGTKWIFKAPAGGSYSAKFLLDLETAIARIQSKAGQTRPAIYQIKLNGKDGIIQQMFDSHDAFPTASAFNPVNLSPEDILVLQQTQIFDWMVSNFDTHTGQWLRLSDGRLLGIDKGQAFKFFGKDKLDWDYIPVYPLSPNGLTYQPLWKAFVDGKKVDLQDPTTGALGDYIDALMAIDDAEYKDLLRPYAVGLYNQGIFKDKAQIETFLDAAVKRKNDLKKDFGTYWAKAQAARAKNLPKAPAPPTPATPPPITPAVASPAAQTSLPPSIATGDLGDISSFDYFAKQDILDDWIALGGGKKVTPAWGGAKIFKMLDELKKKTDTAYVGTGLTPPTHLQLLRILDDAGGFKGKPKTYESVTMAWLTEPKSSSALIKMGYAKLPPDLKPGGGIPSPTAVKPIVTPVSSSGTLVPGKDVGDVVGASHLTPDVVKQYPKGTTIGADTVPGGTKFQVVSGGSDGSVWIQTMDPSDSHWTTLYTDLFPSTNAADASLIDGAYFFKYVKYEIPKPSSIAGKTLILGKGPNEDVTIAELSDSKYSWAKGQILAESPQTKYAGQDVVFRVVSNGDGSVHVEFRLVQTGSGWVKYIEVSQSEFTPGSDLFIPGGERLAWKLTGDVLVSSKLSPLAGKNAGDIISALDISLHDGSNNQVLAYAIKDGSTDLMRIRYISGKYKAEIQSSTDPYKWFLFEEADNPANFTTYVWKQHTWHAAVDAGGIPDAIKAMLPAKSVPGVVQTSWIPGKAVGDPITWAEIYPAGTYAGPGAIIANAQTSTHFVRIIKGDDGFMYVFKQKKGKNTFPSNTAGWDLDQKIVLSGDIPFYNTYTAGSGKASGLLTQIPKPGAAAPVKKAAKAAKKAAPSVVLHAPPVVAKPLTGTQTHFAGKSTGDIVTGADLTGPTHDLTQYVDGQVIAERSSWKGKFRLVVVEGKLFQQKQTSAGAWIGTTHITYKYSGEQWKLVNDQVTKPQLTAIKKYSAKMGQPASSKPYSSQSPYKSPTPTPTTSSSTFVPRHIDISAWDDADQKTIATYAATTGAKYSTYLNQESVWSALQSVKYHFQTLPGSKYSNLNELEILRIIDTQAALKKGVPNTHALEAKMIDWLKTPAGKAYVSKKIDAPIAAHDVPEPMTLIDQSGVLPDQQTYSTVTRAESLKQRQDSHARHGGWKTGEKEALRQYTSGAYTQWNAAIRDGTLGSYRSKIIKAQQGMRPSVRPMLLYRMTGFAEFNDPSISSYETLLPYVGRTYVNRGFNSTSYMTGKWSGSVLIEIEAPIGTPMSHAQDYSNYSTEEEVTLAAHLIYQILSVKKKPSGNTVIRVRVIGAATP